MAGMTRGLRSPFRRLYGASPLHLLVLSTSFALTGYAGIRLLDGDWTGILVWFVGAALLHDLVLLPVYALVDRAVQVATARGSREGAAAAAGAASTSPGRLVNHVRVPAFVSLVLLAVYWPLVLGQVGRYERTTGLPADVFLGRWLLLTAALFGASAVWLAVRLRRDRKPATRA